MGRLQTNSVKNVHFKKLKIRNRIFLLLYFSFLALTRSTLPRPQCVTIRSSLPQRVHLDSRINTQLYINDSQSQIWKPDFSHHRFDSGVSQFQQEFSTACPLVSWDTVCTKPALCILPAVPLYPIAPSLTGIQLPFSPLNVSNFWEISLKRKSSPSC